MKRRAEPTENFTAHERFIAMLDAASRRESFPSLENMTYLNTAAEGISPLCVRDALNEYFQHKQLGMDGRDHHFAALDEAKRLVGELYGLSADEIGICSCSSEAYNLAAMALRLQPGDEVVINDLDFPAGATPWLQDASAATTRVWRARQGRLEIENLIPLLSPRTRLVTTSLVSFFNGFMVSLPNVAEAVRKHSPALLAVDVTQALGRVPLDLSAADLIISSTHKWILSTHGGGLVGVPARRNTEWTVPAGGWYNLQDAFGEHRFERAESKPGAASFAVGMPNFPAIYALRAALGYLRTIGVDAIYRAAQPLVLQCLEGLKGLSVELLTPDDPDHLAGIIAMRHPAADRIAAELRRHQIHIMCHAGRLRVALHGYNTSDDVDRFLGVLRDTLAKI